MRKPHEEKIAPLSGIDLADDYNKEVSFLLKLHLT